MNKTQFKSKKARKQKHPLEKRCNFSSATYRDCVAAWEGPSMPLRRGEPLPSQICHRFWHAKSNKMADIIIDTSWRGPSDSYNASVALQPLRVTEYNAIFLFRCCYSCLAVYLIRPFKNYRGCFHNLFIPIRLILNVNRRCKIQTKGHMGVLKFGQPHPNLHP